MNWGRIGLGFILGFLWAGYVQQFFSGWLYWLISIAGGVILGICVRLVK